ncbi:MAG: aspartyl protease family protein, partial [Myxococcota bacterium]
QMHALLDEVDNHRDRPGLLLVAANVVLSLDDPSPYIGLVEQACALTERQENIDRTRQICASLALHRAAPGGASCARGCDQPWSLPMGIVSSVPVVMVSLQGQPPAPFIIDTGASTSVVTPAYAAQVGLNPLEQTDFTVLSSGGGIPTRYALASLTLGGGLTLASVPVALVELPINGIAGIISPQDAFQHFVVELDFRGMSLGLTPREEAKPLGQEWVEFPLIRRDGNPYLMVQVGDRPERPMLVDTGASHTRLELRLEQMGSRLERRGQTVSLSAGGEVKTWMTSGSVSARAGNLVWTMDEPRIYQPVHAGPIRNLGRFGLLGMDMFIGRALVLDVHRRTLAVHRTARLEPWSVGSARTLDVRGALVEHPFSVHEEVTAAQAGQVDLDVQITRPNRSSHFRITTADTWASRGAWMATRPVEGLWDLSSGTATPQDPTKAQEFWLPALVPFRTMGAPTVSVETLDLGNATQVCSRLEMEAEVVDAQRTIPARAAFWECTGTPWRSAQMEVTEAGSGKLLWGFVQRP